MYVLVSQHHKNNLKKLWEGFLANSSICKEVAYCTTKPWVAILSWQHSLCKKDVRSSRPSKKKKPPSQEHSMQYAVLQLDAIKILHAGPLRKVLGVLW